MKIRQWFLIWITNKWFWRFEFRITLPSPPRTVALKRSKIFPVLGDAETLFQPSTAVGSRDPVASLSLAICLAAYGTGRTSDYLYLCNFTSKPQLSFDGCSCLVGKKFQNNIKCASILYTIENMYESSRSQCLVGIFSLATKPQHCPFVTLPFPLWVDVAPNQSNCLHHRKSTLGLR